MGKTLIDFEWWRDSKGYRKVSKYPGPWKGLPQTPGEEWIIPESKEPALYRPLDEHDLLYREFAETAKSATGALDFVKRWGLLTAKGVRAEDADSIYRIIASAQEMYAFIRHPQMRKTGNLQFPRMKINAVIYIDHTGIPKIKLTPKTLLDALWLQLVNDFSQGTSTNECKHCGTWFRAGAGTDRRQDAEFCSKEHQIAYNSLKRSEKSRRK